VDDARWAGGIGSAGVGGFVEQAGETGPQVREQGIGVCQAGLRRQELDKLFGEGAERELKEDGIEVLERRVEERGGFGEQTGHVLWRERAVVVRGERRGGGRGAVAAGRAEETARAVVGLGQVGWRGGGHGARVGGAWGLPWIWARVGVLGQGVAEVGLRRGRASQSAGQRKAAGDGVAHCAAEAADDARGDPDEGLGRHGGSLKRVEHGGGYRGYLTSGQYA